MGTTKKSYCYLLNLPCYHCVLPIFGITKITFFKNYFKISNLFYIFVYFLAADKHVKPQLYGKDLMVTNRYSEILNAYLKLIVNINVTKVGRTVFLL